MEAIVEKRRALMVASNHDDDDTKPILRVAHFLQPSAASPSDAEPPTRPLSPLPSSPLPPLKLEFPSWSNPPRYWKEWVDLMEPKHSSIWRKVGIFEAVKASAAPQVAKDVNLILGLARKWCPDTNTFVFSWGEATITLEDVMAIGGYSVSGSPVLGPTGKTAKMLEIERKLNQARSKILQGKCRKPGFRPWAKEFMSSGSEIEHEAFLALFLSWFVFPRSWNSICPRSVWTAVQLAQGKKLAFAPAILANTYADLRRLRRRIDSLDRGGVDEDDSINGGKLTRWAPFQLVQVWAWERFPSLRPTPNLTGKGEPRFNRWVKLKCLKLDNVGSTLDSSGRSFLWRPYCEPANHSASNSFYGEKDKWAIVSDESDEELRSFAGCLIACKLDGSDGKHIESYHPHRVAMQFGFDQDLPGKVKLSNFKKPIGDVSLYVPSLLSKPGVTARYLNWWKKLKSGQEGAPPGDKNFKRTAESSKKSLEKWMEENNLSAPPGFKRKWDGSGCDGSSDEDDLTIGEFLRSKKKGDVGNSVDLSIEGSNGQGRLGRQIESVETNGVGEDKESRIVLTAVMKAKELRARLNTAEEVLKELGFMVIREI